jgi:hypothetical protein
MVEALVTIHAFETEDLGMTLRSRGQHNYGDAQGDIREELRDYSRNNGYEIEHFVDAVCACGKRVFVLKLDDPQGVAVRVCAVCKNEHPLGDSADFMEEAEIQECECPCGAGLFEITAGVALYQGSEDVKWLYIGCRCVACGLTACYGDWKNEYPNYREFLAKL